MGTEDLQLHLKLGLNLKCYVREARHKKICFMIPCIQSSKNKQTQSKVFKVMITINFVGVWCVWKEHKGTKTSGVQVTHFLHGCAPFVEFNESCTSLPTFQYNFMF